MHSAISAGNAPIDYEKLHYRGDLIWFTARLARRKLDMHIAGTMPA